MTPDEEMQTHYDAQLKAHFDLIFGSQPPPPPAIQKTQEGRVIRVVADESIATRDAVG